MKPGDFAVITGDKITGQFDGRDLTLTWEEYTVLNILVNRVNMTGSKAAYVSEDGNLHTLHVVDEK